MTVEQILSLFFLAGSAAVLGDIFVMTPIMRYVRKGLLRDNPNEKYQRITRGIGMVERALYVFAWYFGQFDFVAVWLVFKVASGWSGWGENSQEGTSEITREERAKKEDLAHARFSAFVFGTGLSLLTAAVIVLLGRLFLAFLLQIKII